MNGYLRVHVHTVCKLFPLKNARVEIFRIEGSKKISVMSVLTDENGYTPELKLETKDKESDRQRMFGVYSVTAEAEGFLSGHISETVVYENAVKVHSIELILRETV